MKAGSHTGNTATAERWARLIRECGHAVSIESVAVVPECDLLIALHAGHSAKSVLKFAATSPGRPIVLAASGTDLYSDIRRSKKAQRCLQAADRIVVLQPEATREIPKSMRSKCRVIYQSMTSIPRSTPLKRCFEVAVIGHLRPVKDPFRAAMAARSLPQRSRIKVVHLGAALTKSMERRARRETALNPRYEWLGEQSYKKTLARLARCRLLVHSSKTEGGANVVSEAIMASVPILASRIPGNVGLLGGDYPGYFEFGGTDELCSLLLRSETDRQFYDRLASAVANRQHLFSVTRERESWRELLEELSDTAVASVSKSSKSKKRPTGKPGATARQSAAQVKAALSEFIDAEKAAFYPRFFKAGKGEYAEGDKFIGVTVPNQRKVARKFRDLPDREIRKLLADPIHEHRLTGLLVLVQHYERAKDDARRAEIVDFYLGSLDRVNNWDLVDASAHKILGDWIRSRDRSILDELADSDHLWRQRVSVIACLPLIKDGDFADILRLSERFLTHPHDLMHKAVGWMLREAGKQDESILNRFLNQHYKSMPRTMLRYAIEKLPEPRRQAYLTGAL